MLKCEDEKVKTVVQWAICQLRFETPRQLKYYVSDGLESKPVRKMSDYFTENNQFLCFGAKNHISRHIPEYLTSKFDQRQQSSRKCIEKETHPPLPIYIHIIYSRKL